MDRPLIPKLVMLAAFAGITCVACSSQQQQSGGSSGAGMPIDLETQPTLSIRRSLKPIATRRPNWWRQRRAIGR